jgi:hypothetical protein
VSPLRNNSILSPSFACRVDEGKHGLEQPVGRDTESDEGNGREQGLDSRGISVSKNENRGADGDNRSDHSDNEGRPH